MQAPICGRAAIANIGGVGPPGADWCFRAQTVGIVGGSANPTNPVLEREWRALGIDARLLGPAQAGLLEAGDVAVGRLDVRRTLDGVEQGLLELHRLAHRGVRVLNGPRALLRTHDKLRTYALLRAAGLPHPPTEHVPVRRLPSLEPPLVLKPRFGSWGSDVIRCDSRLEVERAFGLLARRRWFARQGVLAQELIPPRGYDLRLLVAGGRVVGAVRRCARTGEWRTNISLGGHPEPVRPPAEALALALRAVAAVGADLVGVDLLPTDGGYCVIELNGAVDFDDPEYSVGRRNVYEAAADALHLLAGAATGAAASHEQEAVVPNRR